MGEYSIKNSTDCDDTEYCTTDQFKDVLVEEMIPHPNFESKYLHHDIALIRLSRYVVYDDYIEPVCMPWVLNSVFRRKYPVGTNMTIVGWGKTMTGE